MFLKSAPIQTGCLLLLMLLVTGCVGEKSPEPVDPSESGGQLDTVSDPIGEQTAVETVEATEVAPQAEIVLDTELGQLLSELGDGTTEERIAASTALSERVTEVIERHADWMVAGSDSQRRGIMLIMTGKAQQYPEQSFDLVQHALQDSDPKVRSIGIQLIRQLIPSQAVQLHASLLTMMKSSEETTENRVSVLRLINLVPGDALATEAALGEIIQADGNDDSITQAALQSYVKLAPVQPAISTLIGVLEESDSDDVKRTSAVLLGKYGTKSKAAVELLGEQLESDDEDLQEAAAEALSRIGSPSIETLVEKLDSQKLLTRQMAIFTLGVIGPSAAEHVERLEKFITPDDPDTSLIAKEAIFSILKQQR